MTEDKIHRRLEEQRFEVFGQMMTESECDAWYEGGVADWQTQENMRLIKACALSDVGMIHELLGERSYGEIIEAQYIGHCKFPLHLLTQYSRVVWGWWSSKQDKEFATEMLERIEVMEQFWVDYYGWKQMPAIEWQPCVDFMECSYFDDDDILELAVRKYRHNPIDTELYKAMGMFDFDKVEALLAMGANPNRWLLSPPNQNPKYYEWNALMELWNESPDSTFVDSFKEAVSEDDEWNIVSLIFSAAAYANMFKLLERYGYDPSEMSRL